MPSMNPEDSLQNKTSLAPYKIAVSRYIRSTMVLKNVKYEDLADALAGKGVKLTASNLRNRVSKGLFSADMFILILEVLEHTENALEDIIRQASSAKPPM